MVRRGCSRQRRQLTGRGNYLLQAGNPCTEVWSVVVFQDLIQHKLFRASRNLRNWLYGLASAIGIGLRNWTHETLYNGWDTSALFSFSTVLRVVSPGLAAQQETYERPLRQYMPEMRLSRNEMKWLIMIANPVVCGNVRLRHSPKSKCSQKDCGTEVEH